MKTKSKLGILAVLILLTGPLATAASAAEPDSSGVVERGDGQQGFVYWSDGYLVIVGSALEFCLNPVPPTGPQGMTVNPPAGSVIEFSRSNVSVSVYEYPGPDGPDDPSGGFEFLIANCGAIFDGDDATEPIVPVATGEVRLRAKSRTDATGVTYSHNSLVGKVTTTAGDEAHLSTFAQVIVTDGGATLIDLTQLVVRYGG